FRRVLEVNLVAPFLLAKAFGAQMLAQKLGSIVNVASIAGITGVADRAAYNASKHGLIGLTGTLAAEGGGRGVRGNGVGPGLGENGNGSGGSGWRKLYGRGYYGTSSNGAVCVTGGYCAGNSVFGG